jgi:hypothetical protein
MTHNLFKDASGITRRSRAAFGALLWTSRLVYSGSAAGRAADRPLQPIVQVSRFAAEKQRHFLRLSPPDVF